MLKNFISYFSVVRSCKNAGCQIFPSNILYQRMYSTNYASCVSEHLLMRRSILSRDDFVGTNRCALMNSQAYHHHMHLTPKCAFSSRKATPPQSPISSFKAKKRVPKKTRQKKGPDEDNHIADGFQVDGPSSFLTFVPDFSYPKLLIPKAPRRGFEIKALSTCDEYDLPSLCEAILNQGLYIFPTQAQDSPTEENTDHKSLNQEEVLHFVAKYQISEENRQIYFFREGSVVFWNFEQLEQESVLKFIKEYEVNPYSREITEDESEKIYYSYGNSSTKLKESENMIVINTNQNNHLDRYAISNALSMSVKLGVWEASLDRYIERIEFVTEELQHTGKVVLSQEQVLQRLGQLFALQHLINLSSDFLDTPDFYWDHEQLEKIFNRISGYLSIRKRTSVMNTKLNHCIELMDLLKSHLNEKHSARLEWIIIILIMIEVFFEILHYL